MMGITQRQADALDFIEAYMCAHSGVAPSLEEIAQAIGLAKISKGYVHQILTNLEKRGHIRRMPKHRRAIEILRPGAT